MLRRSCAPRFYYMLRRPNLTTAGNNSHTSWSCAATPQVEYSWGATEVKASLPGVGAIVDITETGSSLRANNLRVC